MVDRIKKLCAQFDKTKPALVLSISVHAGDIGCFAGLKLAQDLRLNVPDIKLDCSYRFES